MKNWNFRFSAIVSKLCVALMAFLGYSCDDKDGGDDQLLMYGCPMGHWEIKGEVTDEANQPVSEATVKVTLPDVNSTQFAISEVKTDETGLYSADGAETAGEFKVVCIPDDPALEPDSTVVRLVYSGGNPNNMWDMGSASVTVNFKLKKSNKEEK